MKIGLLSKIYLLLEEFFSPEGGDFRFPAGEAIEVALCGVFLGGVVISWCLGGRKTFLSNIITSCPLAFKKRINSLFSTLGKVEDNITSPPLALKRLSVCTFSQKLLNTSTSFPAEGSGIPFWLNLELISSPKILFGSAVTRTHSSKCLKRAEVLPLNSSTLKWHLLCRPC